MDCKYLLIDRNKFKIQNIYCKCLNDQAIAENFHPDLNLSNLEPFHLSFTYNGGTD